MIKFLKILFCYALCLCLSNSYGQEYGCENKNYDFLKAAIGQWEVKTKDRIAVGEYQENEGRATISKAIDGCGISISFRGSYKGKPYAREAIVTGLDSTRVQMVSMDSEHGGFLTYEGGITNDTLEVIWYRNKEVGRLQSKYKLYFSQETEFLFSSFLSTDYGETWALTHQRDFTRSLPAPQTSFFAVIVRDLDRSITWYSELLGFTLINRNTIESRGLDMANLENGKTRLELIEISSSVSPDELLESKQKMQGHFKVGFSVNDIELYVDKLRAMDSSFREQIVTDPVSGQSMLVFKDPDGNRIQLFEQ